MSALRRVPLFGRRALVVALVLFVAGALVVFFSGSLTRSTDIEALAEQARADNAALRARVEAAERERLFFESDGFVRWAARIHGFGEAGEIRFQLPDDAPAPPVITPIGPQDRGAPPLAPLDAWMELLFGA